MSCHESAASTTQTQQHQQTEALLIGHPNVGKSTLFNLLTGSHQRVINAPRTTVELSVGTWKLPGQTVRLTDLPGTYSLNPQSLDEEVTRDAVAGASPEDTAIVLLDATALASSLYLLGQVLRAGRKVVAGVTMADVGQKRGTLLNLAQLEAATGVRTVLLNPRRGTGAAQLAEALTVAPAPGPQAVAVEEHEDLFDWVAEVLTQVEQLEVPPSSRSDKIDRVLLNGWVGLPLFLAVIWATFQLTTTVAGPLQDWLESLVSGPFTEWVTTALTWVNSPEWLLSAVADGLLAGVGTVLSFLPLMVIIFALIYLLEDSGYLARVAVLTDRLLEGMGLDGRAVLPLVLGFGCNVPALSATKTLPHARQRLLTGLLVPFSSCTARLVIYLLLASVFFPGYAGTVVFGMYVASALVIIGMGWVLNRTMGRERKGTGNSNALLLVLPEYQWPRLVPMLQAIALRCRAFMVKAGGVILLLSVAVWLLMAVPTSNDYTFGDAETPAQHTVFGAVSESLSPVFAPAGFGDWHASAALITGFVAKEAVVGTLATTYGLEEPEDPAEPGDLGTLLRESFTESSGGHGAAAALAFMVFCLVYTPCLVAVGEQRRLFGGRVTALATGGSLALAWVLAVAVFQIGRLL